MYLFIDTETTDLPDGESVKDGQARVCQVAMLLTDAEGNSIAEFSTLIKPDGWVVGDESGAVHGFTTEKCEKYGLDHRLVYGIFQHFAAQADVIVAHNTRFDRQMMKIENAYNGMGFPENKWVCTMRHSTDICKIPPTEKMIAAGMHNQFKAPSLNQALQTLCNRTMGSEAHDALWDVRACKEIFFALKARAENLGQTFPPADRAPYKGKKPWTPRKP